MHAALNVILVLLELFCIPTIKSKNKEKLNVIVKNNFLAGNNIFWKIIFYFNVVYKLSFLKCYFFSLDILMPQINLVQRQLNHLVLPLGCVY